MTDERTMATVIPRRWDLHETAIAAVESTLNCGTTAAWRELKALLLDGRVTARDHLQRPMAAEDFRFAEFALGKNGIVSLVNIANFAKTPWFEVDMDALRSALADIKPRLPKDDDTRLAAELVENIKKFPVRSKSQRLIDMKVLGLNFTGRAFGRAFEKAAKMTGKTAELSKAGRKPKSNHRTK